MPDGITPSQEGRSRLANSGEYSLRITLPGISRDNIMVAVADGCVEVHGRAWSEWQEEAPGIQYYESEELTAHHQIPLPPDADLERARVTLADGEVLILIPRKC